MASPSYWGQLVNLLASSRKLNLIPFGLFNTFDDLSFIAGPPSPPTSSNFQLTTSQTFALGGGITIDAAVSNVISVSVQAAIPSTTIVYNGTPFVPHGTYLYIRYAQDNTGHAVTLPSNLINIPAFTVPATPNTTTVIPIMYDTFLSSWKYFGDPFTGGAEPNGQ